jgi:hypothetical protein
MMKRSHLHLEPPRTEGDVLEAAASLKHPDGRCERLWWRVPTGWTDAVTTWADPFVVGLLFPIMQAGRDVQVHGPVSPSLVANLETFMGIWQEGFPDQYRAVRIRAREEVEAPPPAVRGQTVVPFSCGVDSCFTVFRHSGAMAGPDGPTVTAGAVINGFDIWLDEQNAAGMYEGLLGGARAMLDSVGTDCIPMSTNYHDLATTWKHSFGSHLASGMHLLAGRFDATMVADDAPHSAIGRAGGDRPIGDPLLGREHFDVSSDGAEVLRYDKAELLSQWPEAMQHLRVCFENPGRHTNCCRCQKCIRTILSFRVAGCPLPPAFPHDVSDEQIRRVRFLHLECMAVWWEDLAAVARERGFGGEPWVRAASDAVRRNRRRWMWNRLKRPLIPVRNAVRLLFRGSTQSRSERAAAGRHCPNSES